jgi:nickel-dependent lactate racemase
MIEEKCAMRVRLRYGTGMLNLEVPDSARVLASSYPAPAAPGAELVLAALRQPFAAPPLAAALAQRRPGDVVIVVSDITRPIPYAAFLGQVLAEIEAAGVPTAEILILIATGMHRPSTAEERRQMFGADVCARCRIVDHCAGDEAELTEIPGRSWSGRPVRLNRHFMNAGFRFITGLVEPHFMAGFSGGRKAVCPGLASLETLGSFHGYEFLAASAAENAHLDENPCHLEALSVARLAGVDFSLNLVLNHEREVVRAFAGELEAAHAVACGFARTCACPQIATESDLVLTSCGGYPLDATFYQCVKGMVSCLPAVKRGGVILAAGSCLEGVGSAEYTAIMHEYAGRWREFLDHIRSNPDVRKDQWEFQMQARALAKVGDANLCFATDGLSHAELRRLSVQPVGDGSVPVAAALQTHLALLCRERQRAVAVIPEGPYCAPVNF